MNRLQRIPKSDWLLIALACFVFALAFCLGGCATAPKQEVPDLPANVAAKQSVTVDPELIAPCKPLPLLDVRPYSQSDTLDPIDAWSNVYTDCSNRFAKYVVITSKLLNINTNLAAQKAQSTPNPQVNN
jgi:PBP1b-binding outer membrane lipoprotein LpoB